MLGERRRHAAGLGQEQPADAVEMRPAARRASRRRGAAPGRRSAGGGSRRRAAGSRRSRCRRSPPPGSGGCGAAPRSRSAGRRRAASAGDLGLDRAPRHHPLQHVVEPDAGDVGALLRLDQHQALVGEAVDRGGHRQARHAEALAERGLVDRRARRQLAADDRLLERRGGPGRPWTAGRRAAAGLSRAREGLADARPSCLHGPSTAPPRADRPA